MGRDRNALGALVAVVALMALAVLWVAPLRQEAPPLPAPTETAVASSATSTPTPSASPSPSASAPPAAGTFENAVLGYRITLPEGYRRSLASIVTGRQILGVDVYTRITEQEMRAACLKDAGDVGFRSPDEDPDVRIAAHRNDRGMSALEWANTPQVPGGRALSTHQQVESLTIGGQEAVKLVEIANGDTSAFVVRARDRIYEIGAPFSYPAGFAKTWLDDVAKTFVMVEPAAFPSPTPTTPPPEAARQLALALAAAFAAKDADAVARLMPDCWLNVYPVFDPAPAGSGVLWRSVEQFREGLRRRFAAGDLTVTVGPSPQADAREEGMFLVRSDWKEPGRTTRIDLHLVERQGRWQWLTAEVHYTQRTDYAIGILCREPWGSTHGWCERR